MKLQLKKAETSVILIVFIQDSSSTIGAGLGSLDQTSSIVGGYVKRGGTGVALAVDENVTTEGTYQAPSAAGKVRIGTPANMTTGVYELHFHNDLFTTADYLVVSLGGASNMAPLLIEIQLTDFDMNTTLTDASIVNEWETQSQADPTGFHVNVLEVNGTAQTANDNGADINTLVTETAKVPKSDSNVTWNATALASIEAECDDAITANASIIAMKAVTDDMKTLDTTIATVTSDSIFTITAGLTGDDDINNSVCSIWDTTGTIFSGSRKVKDYDHGTLTVTLDRDTAIALQAGDRFIVWNMSYGPGSITDIVSGVYAHVMSELASVPSGTPTFEQSQMMQYMALRNKQVQNRTSGTQTITNDAGAAIATSALTDSGGAGGTFTKNEFA